MDELLTRLLSETQSSAEGPRTQAEQHLQSLYFDPAFPHSLLNLASNDALTLAIRQSALLTLKNFVLAGWSPSIDDFKGQVLVPEAHKDSIRDALLALATNATAERRIQSAAGYVVAKIAAADLPDHWRGLLPALLQLISGAAEAGRTYGALRVLAELVEDGLNEQQFFAVAQELVEALYSVAGDEGRPPTLRALAVSVFKGCFDTLEMVLEDHKTAVKNFAESTVGAWMPLLKAIYKGRLPSLEVEGSQDVYNGHIALKLQVVKVLMKIRMIFPAIISPQSVELFSAAWDELSSLQPTYLTNYLEEELEGRLEDADGLPYSLDFLVLEDLDFMQACIRAPPVRKQLEAQLKSQSGTDGTSGASWVVEVLRLTIFYAQITTEEEGLWQVDSNLFLSEEASVTTNYTARTACGDFAIKLGEWLAKPTLEALLSSTRTLFTTDSSWRAKESALYILNQLLSDWQDVERKVDPQVSASFLEFTHHAMQQSEIFLRARGFMVASVIIKATGETLHQAGASLLDATLRTIAEDDSDIVRVSCIRALQNSLACLPPSYTLQYQSTIISTLSHWISSLDSNELSDSDDLLITLLGTLRDAILLDTRVTLIGDALTLLFNVASRGAANFQITELVTEVFEEICSTIAALGNDAYAQLIDRVLPSLMGAFDSGSVTEENSLTNLAAELLTSLTSYAQAPLPPSFIPAILSKLTPHLLHSTTPELLKSSTLVLRNLLQNDPQQLLSHQDPSTPDHPSATGLETTLHVISRLLSPSVPDASASEVGGLAGALVEHAGADRLGPYMQELLRAIAIRLATASQAQMIQSLILVFARLCIDNAREVIDFLAQLQVPASASANSTPSDPTSPSTTPNGAPHRPTTTALHTLLSAWLANSTTFAGASAIHVNVQALARIYFLHDPRVAAIPVKGDLLANPVHGGRIVTRSRARLNPDTWTTVGADVKIVKVLAEEVVVAGGAGGGGGDGALAGVKVGGGGVVNGGSVNGGVGDEGDGDEEDGDEDGDWESEPGILDLGLGSTKESLMKWGDADDDDRATSASRREGGSGGEADETQAVLGRFFGEVVREVGFEERIWPGLSEGEKERVKGLLGFEAG